MLMTDARLGSFSFLNPLLAPSPAAPLVVLDFRNESNVRGDLTDTIYTDTSTQYLYLKLTDARRSRFVLRIERRSVHF